MKDYYLLVGLNSKEVKITKVSQNGSGLVEVEIENKNNVSLLRKYSRDIDWWVLTKRYKNGRFIEVLPINILNKILDISNDLMEGYC